MRNDETMTVSAAEFQRNIGRYQDIALTRPVAITKNGRERTILISADEYNRLKQRDRKVILAGELTEKDVKAIQAAEIDPKYDSLKGREDGIKDRPAAVILMTRDAEGTMIVSVLPQRTQVAGACVRNTYSDEAARGTRERSLLGRPDGRQSL
jgi:prevent-host-death family protein